MIPDENLFFENIISKCQYWVLLQPQFGNLFVLRNQCPMYRDIFGKKKITITRAQLNNKRKLPGTKYFLSALE